MSQWGIPWLDRFRGTPLEARALDIFEQRQAIEREAYEVEDRFSMPIDADDRNPAEAKAAKERARMETNQALAERQAKLVAASQALENDFVQFRTEQAYAPDWQAMSKGLDALGQHLLDEELNKALELGDLDGALDLLEKAAGHKYIKRIPTGKPKPKYHYVYNVTSKHMGKSPKVGEKVAVAHGEQKGHYEVTAAHDDNHVTMRHDETGHEMRVHKDHVHEMVAQEHEDAVDAAHKRLARTHEAAQRHGSEAQQKRAKAALDAHRDKYGYTAAAERAGKEHMETAKREAAKIYDEGQREREAAAAKKKAKPEKAGFNPEDAKGADGKYRYGANNRPVSYANVPKGAQAEPDKRFRHGVAVYDKPLTEDEIKSFELTPVLNAAGTARRVGQVISELSEYAEEYTEMIGEDRRTAEAMARQRLSEAGVLDADIPAAVVKVNDGLRTLATKEAPAKAEAPQKKAPEPPGMPEKYKAPGGKIPQWHPTQDEAENIAALERMTEGTAIAYLSRDGYDEFRYVKRGKTWHNVDYPPDKMNSTRLGKELAFEAEERPRTYVEGKLVAGIATSVYEPEEGEAPTGEPAPAPMPKTPPPVADGPMPQNYTFGPSQNALKEAPTGTTYKWEQYGHKWEVEKLGSARWEVRSVNSTYQTTPAGVKALIPHQPEGGVTKERFGEALAKKAGMSLEQYKKAQFDKHAAAVNKGVRKGDKVSFGQLESRWKGNTMKLEHEGTTYYSNGHTVVSDKHLTAATKKKLDAMAAGSDRSPLTMQMLERVRPKSTDVEYHYVGPHPEHVGDTTHPIAVYASKDGEHVTLVNTHLSPPPTLYGVGNETVVGEPGRNMTISPLVASRDDPEGYLVMPMGFRGQDKLDELKGLARKLKASGEYTKKSLAGLEALSQYLNGDAAEALEKSMFAKQERLFQKADDGKPGESLGETSTQELEQTLADIKHRLGSSKDPGLQSRHEAIAAELKRRGGGDKMEKAGPYIGPKGGKYADPQHKTAWKEGGGEGGGGGEKRVQFAEGVHAVAKQGKTGQWSAQIEGKTGQRIPGASGATAEEAISKTKAMWQKAGGGSGGEGGQGGAKKVQLSEGVHAEVKQGKTGQWSAQIVGKTGGRLPGGSGATAEEAISKTKAMFQRAGGKLMKSTELEGLDGLHDYLCKAGETMPTRDPGALPKHPEAKLGHPKSSSIGSGSADGGELDGVGKTGGSGDSAPAPGTGKDGMPQGTTMAKAKFSADDRDEDEQMKDHKKPLEQSVAQKSLTPAAQRQDQAYEHAKKVSELRKSEPDLVVGGTPHPLSHTAVHGATDERAEALLKSEFYYGPPPTLAPPDAILRKSVLCKSEACGQKFAAALTACPHCGTDTVQSRMLPKGGYVGGRGDSAVVLTKSNEPLLRPPPQEPDLYFPGKE